jgi:hypothetical protein
MLPEESALMTLPGCALPAVTPVPDYLEPFKA